MYEPVQCAEMPPPLDPVPHCVQTSKLPTATLLRTQLCPPVMASPIEPLLGVEGEPQIVRFDIEPGLWSPSLPAPVMHVEFAAPRQTMVERPAYPCLLMF